MFPSTCVIVMERSFPLSCDNNTSMRSVLCGGVFLQVELKQCLDSNRLKFFAEYSSGQRVHTLNRIVYIVVVALRKSGKASAVAGLSLSSTTWRESMDDVV